MERAVLHLVLLLVFFLGAAGCSSSDTDAEQEVSSGADVDNPLDADDASDVELPPVGQVLYAGSTAAASLSNANVSRFASNAVVGQGLVYAEVNGAGRGVEAAAASVNQLGLAFTLYRHIWQTLLDFTPQMRDGTPLLVQEYDQTFSCDAGSVRIFGVLDASAQNLYALGELTLDYSNCRFGDEILNGSLLIQGEFHLYFGGFPAPLFPSDATIEFAELGYANLPAIAGLSGDMRFELELFGDALVTIDELVSIELESGRSAMIENTTLDIGVSTYLDPRSHGVAASGRLYDADSGYVDFETVTAFGLERNQEYPHSGEMFLRSDDGASFHLLVLSDEHLLLEADLDNNQSYEAAVWLQWQRLATGLAIVDADADGILDEWERQNGLDPADPADALENFDQDSFINLEEYRGFSDPNKTSSVPAKVANLEIDISGEGEPVTGAAYTYSIMVRNNGPEAVTNDRLIFSLPAGVRLAGITGAYWDCEDSASEIICSRPSGMTPGGQGTLEITVFLPDTAGDLDFTASISSEYADPEPQANSVDQALPVDPLAPSLNLDLGATAFDLEIDPVRQRFYLSLPDQNAIAVVSLDGMTLVRTVDVGSRPRGITLGADGDTLYVALGEGAAVAAVDLDDFTVTETRIAHLLRSNRIHDVFASAADTLLVSPADFYLFGYPNDKHLARLDPTGGNALSPVGFNWSQSNEPVFAAAPGSRYVYTLEGNSQDRVSKFDLLQPDIPVVLGAQLPNLSHANVSDLAVSLDDAKIMISNGLVLDAATLDELGRIDAGAPHFGSHSGAAMVGLAPNKIGFYDLADYRRVETIHTACKMSEVTRIAELDADGEWLLIGGQTACRVSAPDPLQPVPNASDLAISVSTYEGTSVGDAFTGGDLMYLIDVANLGPKAVADAVVTVELPVGTSLRSEVGPWNCDHETGTLTCTEEVTKLGETRAMRVLADLPNQPASIALTASISSSLADPDPANNTAIFDTEVAPPPVSEKLVFAESVFDFEIDEVRQQLYLSIPDLNRLAVIDLAGFTVTDNVDLGGSPRGLALSPDGDRLYIAIDGAGSVGVLDLVGGGFAEIAVAAELGSVAVYDVIAPRPGEVFVSASTNSSSAYLATIDTANGNLVSRLHGDRVIRSSPRFAAAPDPRYLYLSNNNFFKIDLEQVGYPIVLEMDNHFVDDSKDISISGDGSMLSTPWAQLIRADDLTQKGWLDYGVSELTDDSKVLVAEISGRVAVYDLITMRKIESVYNDCDLSRASRIAELQSGQWLLLGDQTLCRVTR